MSSRREQRSGLALFLTVSVLSAALAVSLSSGQISSVRFEPQNQIAQDVGDPGDDTISFSQTFTLADVNEDDLADLVVVNTLGGRVLVHISRGDGTFEEPLELTPTIDELDVDPSCVAVGDVGSSFDTGDGPEPDGNADLIVGTFDGEVVIFVGDGEGNFEVRPEDAIETGLLDVLGITLADFNDDVDLDIALLGSLDEAVVLLGDDGNFDPDTETFSTDADTAIDIGAGDINDDDDTDLVILDQEGRTISLLLGLGDGTFEEPVEESTISDNFDQEQFPTDLAVFDFEENGEDDVVIVNSGQVGEFQLMIRRGPDLNSFDPFVALFSSTGIALGDFDDNGITDALVSAETNVSPAFVPDDGGSGFSLNIFGVGGFGSGLAVASGDIDNDGLPDFVQLNNEGNGFSVGLNVSNDPTPTGGTPPPSNTPTAGPSGTPTPTVPTNTPTPTATATPIPTVPLSICEISIPIVPLPNPVDVDWGLFDNNVFHDIVVADAENRRLLTFLIDQTMPFPETSEDCVVGDLTPRSFTVPNGTPAALAAGALADLDRRRDVAVVGGGFLTLFYGDGAGDFDQPTSMLVGSNLSSVVIGDINTDGNADVVVADPGANTLRILYGSGGRNFDAPVAPGPEPPATPSPGPTPGRPSFVLTADLNNDGFPDLAEGSREDSTVSVRFQNPSQRGQFNVITTVDLRGMGQPTAMVADLFNDDSLLDLGVTIQTGGDDSFVVLVATRSGSTITYVASNTVGTDPSPSDIGVGSFASTGNRDVVVTTMDRDLADFYEEDTESPFRRLDPKETGSAPVALTVADFDGDTKDDVVIANRDSGTLTIFRSAVPPSTPTPLPTATPSPTGTVTGTGTITPTATQTPTETPTPNGSSTVTGTRTATATHTRSPKPGAFALSDSSCAIRDPSDRGDQGGFALLWAIGLGLVLRRQRARKNERRPL